MTLSVDTAALHDAAGGIATAAGDTGEAAEAITAAAGSASGAAGHDHVVTAATDFGSYWSESISLLSVAIDSIAGIVVQAAESYDAADAAVAQAAEDLR